MREILIRETALALLRIQGMNLNNRIGKLRQQQQAIAEALKQEEAKASIRQRKQKTRGKIILGAVLLEMPESERELMLPMIFAHLTERDRHFINELLAAK